MKQSLHYICALYFVSQRMHTNYHRWYVIAINTRKYRDLVLSPSRPSLHETRVKSAWFQKCWFYSLKEILLHVIVVFSGRARGRARSGPAEQSRPAAAANGPEHVSQTQNGPVPSERPALRRLPLPPTAGTAALPLAHAPLLIAQHMSIHLLNMINILLLHFH